MTSVQTYLEQAKDIARPLLASAAQDYDNYSIYNIYSVRTSTNINYNPPLFGVYVESEEADTAKLLAVQHYSIRKPACDFNAIAETYK